MERSAAIQFIVVALLFASIPRSAFADADTAAVAKADGPLSQIFAAWEQRRSRTATVHFDWEPSVDSSGCWSRYQSMCVPKNASSFRFPQNSLRILGSEARYETNRWCFSSYMEYSAHSATNRRSVHNAYTDPFYRLHFHEDLADAFTAAMALEFPGGQEQRHNPRPFTSVVRGDVRTEYFAKADGKYAEARIVGWRDADEAPSGIIDVLQLMPIYLTYRPFFPELGGIRSANCRLLSDKYFVNGVECLAIEETKRSGVTIRYFLDPAREYVVVRYFASFAERSLAQLDISFKATSSDGPTPASWLAIVFPAENSFPGQAQLPLDLNAVVTISETNVSIAADNFSQPKLEPGTLVTDEVAKEHFVVLDHGQRRAIHSFESMKSYDDLLKPVGSPSHTIANSFPSNGWLWCTAAIVFTLAILMRLRNGTVLKIPAKSRES
jgi:hypothetical protein